MHPLLQVQDLTTVIHTAAGLAWPVDGVSFEIAKGETFALLGESGCGKSITALSIMRLLPEASAIASGSVGLDGEDLLLLPETSMRGIRGRRISMIFQEPMLSLNPVMTVAEQIGEVLQRFLKKDRKSTRLNSSHMSISYAVFCLKKKQKKKLK